ncbi:hypothetical protein ACFMBG_12840 [Leisingera sp. D0M16]|uniref:hypothetical protein n=1 Tax=Leisingera coralii TaxID=3351347 RepID=UPI003B7BA6FA
MTICHPLKLIFIKTKRAGGTSFEIACPVSAAKKPVQNWAIPARRIISSEPGRTALRNLLPGAAARLPLPGLSCA